MILLFYVFNWQKLKALIKLNGRSHVPCKYVNLYTVCSGSAKHNDFENWK